MVHRSVLNAIEQMYGYLRMNGQQIGVLATLNGFVFMQRASPRKCSITRMIPADIGDGFEPTILQLLYWLSNTAAVNRAFPEVDKDSNPVATPIWDVERPMRCLASKSKTVSFNLMDSNEILHLLLQPWDARAVKSSRIIFGRLIFPSDSKKDAIFAVPNNMTVAAKLWDSHTFSETDYANEVTAYMRLQRLWKKCVPEFIGCRAVDFCRIIYVNTVAVLYRFEQYR